MPAVNNSNSMSDPMMSRLYNRCRDVKDTPDHFAVRQQHRAEAARCTKTTWKSGDEAVHKELHSPTFRPFLGLCQTNAVPPPLSL